MFTYDQISLADCATAIGISTERDCQFAFIGKVPTRLPSRVVPCGNRRNINDALSEQGIVGIITTLELAPLVPADFGLIISDIPQRAAYAIHEYICSLRDFQWTDFDTFIDPGALIERGAIIAARNVHIGDRSIVMSGAIIRERSLIGKSCRIGPGAVIGADAFETNVTETPWRILAQAGGVEIADYVEIQAKCTIVRATFGGFTKIGEASKFDCQVHLAHDCLVGRNTQIAACAEISGRVTIGNNVFIGPNVSISNGVTIHDNASVTIGSVVTQDVSEGAKVSGNFAIPHSKFLRFVKSISQ